MTTYPLLDTIQAPADLRRLDRTQLRDLARELRQFLLHCLRQFLLPARRSPFGQFCLGRARMAAVSVCRYDSPPAIHAERI